MSDSLRALVEQFSTLAQLRGLAVERIQAATGLNGEQFDLSHQVPSVDRSIAQIDARVVAICELAKGIEPKTDAILVPQSLLDTFSKPVTNLIAQYQTLADQLQNISTTDDGPGNLDPAALTFQSSNGTVNVQLIPSFQAVWNAQEQILSPLHQVIGIVGGPGQTDFSAAASTFAQVLAEMHRQKAELKSVLNDAETSHETIRQALEAVKAIQAEIGRLKEEGEKDRKSLAEYDGEGTQKIAAIQATAEQNQALQKSVTAYQATFDSFQTQLDAREKAMTEGTTKQTRLLASLGEIEEKIKALNEKAEGMLSGATVAGLASAFGGMRDDLSGELKFARWGFFTSIGVLLVSAIPLAVYVIPGLSQLLSLPVASTTQGAGTSELFLQIVGRSILLLPAAWLTRFAAARHATLFRLKEHYAYKHSVASSVDGFKKQAEPYKDAIAAATFFELTDNPADRMDAHGREERHPNPAMEWVMNKLGATPEGKNK